MKAYIYSFLTALLLCTACDNQIEQSGFGNFPDDGVVKISAQLEALQSKTELTPYAGTSLALSIDYGTDSPFTVAPIRWSSLDGGSSWTAESQMLWKDAVSPAKVYAYAPAVEGVTAIENVPFTISPDQSASLTASDLLMYKDEAFIPGNSLTPQQALNITLKHKLSKVVVKLSYADQWGDTPPGIEKVTISETKPTTSLNVKTETLATASGNTINIVTHKVVAAPDNMAYEAIVVPQVVSSGTKLVSIKLENGEEYSYMISSTADITFMSGMQHTINLRIGKDKVLLTGITVADWDASINLGNEQTEVRLISDPNFVAVLKADPYHIPSISIGGKDVIDTSNPAVRAMIEDIDSLIVRDKNIESLAGIRLFKNLTYLVCAYNKLTELDLRGLTNLKSLSCSYNQMTQLKIDNLSNLEEVLCENNHLAQLDLTGLVKLQNLCCSYNYLSELYLSELSQLSFLDCLQNRLTQLDVSRLSYLLFLSCGRQLDAENNLQNLNLSVTQYQSDWFLGDSFNNQFVTLIVVPDPVS